ncbi:hypothetical protein [Cryobacterium mannosilyticum]|uniref:hypothetical protein n=1 Tax=Cryobacterium mannosilyticum TaxID=1259190 RepID=UPI00141B251F|nr:hypothetical protein [Cryobacterium mannosilyticum]
MAAVPVSLSVSVSARLAGEAGRGLGFFSQPAERPGARLAQRPGARLAQRPGARLAQRPAGHPA